MANWKRIGQLSDFPPGEGREFVVEDRIVAVYNVDGTLYALDGVCPHQGGPLGKGTLCGQVVTCPWHGWQFDVVTGRHQLSRSVIQPGFAVRVEGDAIWIDLTSTAAPDGKSA
jgi:nitrite reductase (NADH) small subunit